MALLRGLAVPYAIQSLLLSSIPILISVFANFDLRWDLFRTRFQDGNCNACSSETFDFIIIGGGSAGTVMAARLSETSARVLLLEAGGDPNPVTLVPFFAPIISKPEIDWGYSTEPLQGSGHGFENNTLFWPRGKGLGGSSNTNFMMYMRGNPNDFDNWATITGDPRWNYKSVESYFRKMEDYNGNWDASGHGQGGPLRVEGLRFDPGLKYILEAVTEFGYPIRDPNVFQSKGFSPLDFTMKKGRRFGTHSAYLRPNLGRPNLIIRKYSHVTRIHFDENKRANGVTYFRHGVKKHAEATKEVILSAGSINSPQLLMLSGIGPREHLLEHGIEPLLDVPGVGKNLQDHVCTAYGPFLVNQPVTFLAERNVTFGSLLDYAWNGSGPFAGPLTSISVGTVSSTEQPSSWPNLLLLIGGQGVSRGLPELLTEFLRTKRNLFPGYFGDYQGRDAYFVWQTLALPKSKGEIRLRDRNPLSKPIIDPRYYTDEGGVDIEVMLEGMEIITTIFENSTAIGRELAGQLITKELPGCEGLGRYSRAYRECYLRTLTMTLYHPAGTCAMGKVGEPGTVVDSELRVVGVKGLRVVDASVMPQVTNANINAPTIMIGEVAADMVKETWDSQ